MAEYKDEGTLLTDKRQIDDAQTWTDDDWDEYQSKSNIEIVDGRVQLAEGNIPNSDVFDDPIYQWWAGEGIGASDGSEASDWDDRLAGITATSAQGSPTYRDSQDGYMAVEYDGDDGHEFSPDSSFPHGNDSRSIAFMAYVRDGGCIINYGAVETDELFKLTLEDGSLDIVSQYNTLPGPSYSTDEWITGGISYDGNERKLYLNGSEEESDSTSLDTADTNHSIGCAKEGSICDENIDGYIAEILVSDSAESSSAFSDYHDDRLG